MEKFDKNRPTSKRLQILLSDLTSMSAPEPVLPPHILARRLRDLHRRVHAKMPWGYRLAELLVHLAADSIDSFGRVIYAEFIRAVVRGMPSAPGGKPAFDFVQDVARRGADALPPGYGREFANRVYRILLTKFSDPEIVEDAMSHVMLQAARGRVRVANGTDLRSAESYAITACMNAGRDLLRTKSRRREIPFVREQDDNREVDIADPETFRDLDRSINRRDMARILDAVEDVHPRARDYLEAVLRGDTQADWAREIGVTDAAVSKFVRKIRPTLKDVLREHLRSAARTPPHAGYSYQR